MTSSAGNAPAWLFAFVDLAFLLLLGTTQLQRSTAADLGELVVPRIGSDAPQPLASAAGQRWQIRVHPSVASEPPFELIDDAGGTVRLGMPGLRARLEELDAGNARRPILAPHPDARSEDLLQGLSLIQEYWPERRRATVRWDRPL